MASVLAFMKYEALKLKHQQNHFALKAKIMLAANKAALITLNNLTQNNKKGCVTSVSNSTKNICRYRIKTSH